MYLIKLFIEFERLLHFHFKSILFNFAFIYSFTFFADKLSSLSLRRFFLLPSSFLPTSSCNLLKNSLDDFNSFPVPTSFI